MSAGSRTNWFWSDWLGDQAVRRLTPAERGVWVDCLALMAAAQPVGYLCDDRGRPLTHEEIARVVNATPVEVAELLAAVLEKGVASRDRTGRIFNRRMVRDASKAAKLARNGKRGGDATRLKWQSVSSLLGQNAQQMPRQENRPPIPIRKITTSFPTAARDQKSAGSLASALPTGALARPPTTEQAEAKTEFEAVRPSDLHGDDLKAAIERRQARDALEAGPLSHGSVLGPAAGKYAGWFYLKAGTPEFEAHSAARGARSLAPPPQDKNGGWMFETRWPAGYIQPGAPEPIPDFLDRRATAQTQQ